MNVLTNRELVHRVCDQLHDGLLPVVEKAMRDKHKVRTGDWVRPAHHGMSRNGTPPPKGADLQFLLKCVEKYWEPQFRHLGRAARSQVGLLLDTRNGLLAHYAQGSADIAAAQAREAVTPAVRLLQALEAPNASTATATLDELRTREAREVLAAVLAVPPGRGAVPPVPAAVGVAGPAQAGPPTAASDIPVQRSAGSAPPSARFAGTGKSALPARPAPAPLPYPGKQPANVSRDAKYGCRLDGRVKLEFDLGNGDETLLTTDDHPELVAMVRMVKEHFGEAPGGVFYLNEHGHVLVKAAGRTWYAGEYRRLLEFEFEGRVIGPRPAPGARAGDPWHGPHVGVNYTLTADGRDVYFKREVRKGVVRKELLSSYADASVVAGMARPVKQQGGRLYINEARVLFTPVSQGRRVSYVYLGTVAPEHWFPAPTVPA